MSDAEHATTAIPEGFKNTWTDVFRADTMVHLLIMTSVVTGSIQGWLKDRFAGPLPYALADGSFILAVLLWFAAIVVFRRPMLRAPRGTNMDLLLLAVILVPALYILVPGTPFIVKAAGVRAWSAFPVACLLGLTIVRTPGQVRAHVGVILATCLLTGIYGIIQYIRGPEAALATQLGLARHGETVFYSVAEMTGERDFRAFSTFTFPAPFAAMMVFGILLAAGIVLSRHRPWRQRTVAALLIPVLFIAMTLSGTRAALMVLLVGLVVLAWLRGFSFVQLLLVPLMLVALHVTTVITSGKVVTRYQSLLLSEGILWTYAMAPVRTAIESLSEHPFGLGLGRTGIGVPWGLGLNVPADFFVFSDGDIGRAAVELGILGLVVLSFIIFGLLPTMLRAARKVIRSDANDLSLGIGALVLSTGLVILIGSPLSTAPHAMIWWFLFGALVGLAIKLTDQRAANGEESRNGGLDLPHDIARPVFGRYPRT